MVVGAGNQNLWERFCQAIGREEWKTDALFRENHNRVENRLALEKKIEEVLAGQPTAYWVRLLDEAGIPCGPVNTYRELFDDPQVKHRELVVTCEDPEIGTVPHLRMPVRLSEGQVAVRRTAPRLGEHTREILASLGIDEKTIGYLQDKRVI